MAGIDRDEFRRRTNQHYQARFARHGATPDGVDWNGSESQEAHFAQLIKLLPYEDGAEIDANDLGCGYGAFADYLAARRTLVRYRGYDVNDEMIAAAQALHMGEACSFEVADKPLHQADYGFASGIFTLRLDRTDEECWGALLEEREVDIGGLWVITGFEQRAYLVDKLSTSDTSYTFGKRINLFVNSVTSFSTFPLVLIFYVGVSIFTLSMLYILFLVLGRLITNEPVSGWTSLIVSMWLLGGTIIAFLGVIGLYLSKMFAEVKRRPYTIVRNIYGRDRPR